MSRIIRTIPCLCILYGIVSQGVGLGANIAMSVSASDEQAGLQQALFLVKLLRSEYDRVLREKNQLISKNVRMTREFTLSATTVRNYDETEGKRHYNHIVKRGGRRFEHDDMFKPQPDNFLSKSKSEMLSTVAISSPMTESVTQSALATSISAEMVHEKGSKSFNHSQSTKTLPIRAKTESLLSTKVTSVSINNVTQDFKTLNHHIVPEKSSLPSQMPLAFNPEILQAAIELEKELSLGFQSKNSTFQMSTTWRTSLRVHLAGSTPYPLPLPENHAFCYTNPRSAMCRTFI